MEEEGFESRAVANWFIQRSQKEGKPVSHMKLHKLLYFAHGWYLALTPSEPLLNEFIEAWDYGPVVPSVYHEFKRFGSGPIEGPALHVEIAETTNIVVSIFSLDASIADEDERIEVTEFLEAVWEKYKDFSAIRLSQMTHQQGTPWRQTREETGNRRNADIRDELIQQYFTVRLKVQGNAG